MNLFPREEGTSHAGLRKAALLLVVALSALMPATGARADYVATVSVDSILDAIHASGDQLYDDTTRKAVGQIYIMPVGIDSSSYSITGASTSMSSSWTSSVPDYNYVYSSEYTAGKYALFSLKWDATTATLIMDKPVTDFPTVLSGTRNDISLASASSSETFSFTIQTSAAWSGQYQILIGGYQYLLSEAGTGANTLTLTPAPIGFDSAALYGLTNNVGSGYTGNSAVPIPGSLVLLGSGLLALAGWRKRKGH
ncbi:MAG: hypothetical protein LLG06_13205 [Desulfobacteraceae bacterium]|nr:hypothetical protein [Desulfobacteraceae bacterium]